MLKPSYICVPLSFRRQQTLPHLVQCESCMDVFCRWAFRAVELSCGPLCNETNLIFDIYCTDIYAIFMLLLPSDDFSQHLLHAQLRDAGCADVLHRMQCPGARSPRTPSLPLTLFISYSALSPPEAGLELRRPRGSFRRRLGLLAMVPAAASGRLLPSEPDAPQREPSGCIRRRRRGSVHITLPWVSH